VLFEKLFAHFGLSMPQQRLQCIVSRDLTIPYFNTGVLIIAGAVVSDLTNSWIRFADALCDSEFMRGREQFTEQAALTLALSETGVSMETLGPEMNFPVTGQTRAHLMDIDPLIVHYHGWVEPPGRIKLSGYPLVDARIDRFNRRNAEEAS
jgi:hypothetical protein